MDKENFIQALRNPQNLTDSEFQELETVVSQYPYFQTARAVIASASKSMHKSDAGRKLTKAAIYTTNRNLLKKYVEGDFDFGLANEVQVGIQEGQQSESSERANLTTKKKGGRFIYVEKEKESIEELGKGRFIDLTRKSEDDDDYEVVKISADEKPSTSKPSPRESLVEKPESATLEDPKARPEIDNPSNIKKQVEQQPTRQKLTSKKDVEVEIPNFPPKMHNEELVNEVLKNLEEYHKHKNQFEEFEKKELEQEANDAINEALIRASKKMEAEVESFASQKLPLHGEVDKQNEDEKETEVKKPTSTQLHDRPQVQEIQNPGTKLEPTTNNNNDVDNIFEKMVAEIKSTPLPDIEEKEITSSQSSFVSVSKTQQPQQRSKSLKKEIQSDIIENFIKSNPRIVPQEVESQEEIPDLATHSVEMKDDLATENLAKILARQGKREKAIEIYEKLILLNPDKRSFFAAEISKLK